MDHHGTTHTLNRKLTAGQTYTLREAAAPAGYYTAADQQFEVNLDGTPNAITLYNIKTKVEITKYDITGTNPLPGAKLQVKDMDGNVMDEWTSTDKAHVIEGRTGIRTDIYPPRGNSTGRLRTGKRYAVYC